MIYLNDDPVNVTLFPDNTSQVWKLDEKHLNQERATIRWDFSHEGELIQLAQLRQLLNLYIYPVYLQIDYLPYGRQDKNVSNDSTFALYTFASILNSLYFTEIFIMDPHSKVALDLIDRSQAVYPHGPVHRAYVQTESDIICYPDHGAQDKYSKIYKFDPYIYGNKVRDQATGHILSYEMVGDPLDKQVLIVDDICDGGKTFEILSNDLLQNGAKSVNLFVTHGLFSKGLKPLYEAGIDRIFTNKGEAIRMADGGFGFRKVEKING